MACPEMTSSLVIKRATLVPICRARATALRRLDETSSNKLSASHRVDNYIGKRQLRLPAIPTSSPAPMATTDAKNNTASALSNPPCGIATVIADITIEQAPISPKSPDETALKHSYSTQRSEGDLVQNYRLVWLDSNIAKCTASFESAIARIRRVLNTIDKFTDPDECIRFLREIQDETVLMITSNDLGQSTIPRIHALPQLGSIYIFCPNKLKSTRWIKKWTKIKDIFTRIDSICDLMKWETRHNDRDSTSFNITSVDLDLLDPSFMYTQLLKETLLEIEHEKKTKKELAQFCREQYVGRPHGLQIINEFERDYEKHTPIWWYTRGCFLGHMVNRALQFQEINVIIKMGFFIRDLHEQIERLHTRPREKLIVYRGQGLSYAELETLRTRPGCLFSFNKFLSTSIDRKVSLLFAESYRENSGVVGVLFQISVDPAILTSVPFASLDTVSFFDSEKEVLFSMHTVFRVGQAQLIENRLWQVELALTSDNDKDLKQLTEYLREETFGSTGWYRLGRFIMHMENFPKAKQIYELLTDNGPENNREGLGHHYHQTGLIKTSQGDDKEALVFYRKALAIYRIHLCAKHHNFATIYSNIGSAHKNLKEYSQALEFYQMTLNIQHPFNYSNLLNIYANIAQVFRNTKEYSKALEYYKKILQIQKTYFPFNHSNLASTYSISGEMLYNMEQFQKALKSYRKASEIGQKCFPSNSTDLVPIYNSIGQALNKIGEYSEALEHYQNALHILHKFAPLDTSNEALIYNNIAQIHQKTGENCRTLEYYQKTLSILKRSPHVKHPDLATTYDNVGQAHENMGQYSKALLCYRHAIQMTRNVLPHNYFQLQSYRKHLANVKQKFCLNSSSEVKY